MKFQLTKHRELWEWLADNLSGEDGSLTPEEYLAKYKEQWFKAHNEPKKIYNCCYACDYAVKVNVESPCSACPLWYDCKTGIYTDLLLAIEHKDNDKIYELCMLFNKSPVRPNVEVE